MMSIEYYQNKSVIVEDSTINCATYIIKVLTYMSHGVILVESNTCLYVAYFDPKMQKITYCFLTFILVNFLVSMLQFNVQKL